MTHQLLCDQPSDLAPALPCPYGAVYGTSQCLRHQFPKATVYRQPLAPLGPDPRRAAYTALAEARTRAAGHQLTSLIPAVAAIRDAYVRLGEIPLPDKIELTQAEFNALPRRVPVPHSWWRRLVGRALELGGRR